MSGGGIKRELTIICGSPSVRMSRWKRFTGRWTKSVDKSLAVWLFFRKFSRIKCFSCVYATYTYISGSELGESIEKMRLIEFVKFKFNG